MKNKIKIILYSLFSFLLPLVSFAQTTESIASELDSFYNSAIAIGGVAAVVMIIVGGIYFSVSGGSADKKSEGKKYITSALWGLVLLLGAFVILNTINPELTSLEAPAPPQAEVLENLESPTSTEASSAECPQEVFEGCNLELQTVGSDDDIDEPYCKNGGTPFCDVDPNSPTGSQNLASCNPGGSEPGPKCDTGLARCVDERVVCTKDDTGEGLQRKEVNVINCDDCSDSIQTKEVTINPGGSYKKHLFFPSNGLPKNAQCVAYTYKENSDATRWAIGDTTGSKYCE